MCSDPCCVGVLVLIERWSVESVKLVCGECAATSGRKLRHRSRHLSLYVPTLASSVWQQSLSVKRVQKIHFFKRGTKDGAKSDRGSFAKSTSVLHQSYTFYLTSSSFHFWQKVLLTHRQRHMDTFPWMPFLMFRQNLLEVLRFFLMLKWRMSAVSTSQFWKDNQDRW